MKASAGDACFSALRKRVLSLLRVESAPLNLAIFRIVVFLWIFDATNPVQLSRMAESPFALITAPLGLKWYAQWFLPNGQLVLWLAWTLKALAIFAALGLVSRLSAGLTTVLAWAVLGIPNLFGKTNHGVMFLIWFSALLTFSRASDVLSLDSILRQYRGLSRGQWQPPVAHERYGLPLRLVLVFLGLLYFFPGFWKIFGGGWDWINGQIFHAYLVEKWFTMNWKPVVRLDLYPKMMAFLATAGAVFEIGFVFLILTRFRRWVAVAGILFHQFTRFFMQITFTRLQWMYVAAVDWYGMIRFLVRKVWGEKALEVSIATGGALTNLRGALLVSAGFLSVTPAFSPTVVVVRHRSRREFVPLSVVAGFIFVGLMLTGFMRIQGWPFACFPTFAHNPGFIVDSVHLQIKTADGSMQEIDLLHHPKIRRHFPGEVLRVVLGKIVRAPNENSREEKARAFLQSISPFVKSIRNAQTLTFWNQKINLSKPEWETGERQALLTIENRSIL